MSDSTPITVRVAADVRDRLENLARETRRSRSALAAEGIATFVELEERQIAGIKQALAAVDAGRGVAQADVEAWVASWDADDELPPPTAG